MSKHTPGPWRILPEEVHRDYIRIRATLPGSKYKIANVVGMLTDYEKDAEEVRANANLIATAPQLLEVLEELDAWATKYPSGGIYPETMAIKVEQELDIVVKKARAEIAAARGEG